MDHYLPHSLYPFAATNLRNLVPMGGKCNQRYKHSQDILRGANNVRRRVFDPYADQQVGISVSNSVAFGGEDGITPRWQVDFVPERDECTAWDEVHAAASYDRTQYRQ